MLEMLTALVVPLPDPNWWVNHAFNVLGIPYLNPLDKRLQRKKRRNEKKKNETCKLTISFFLLEEPIFIKPVLERDEMVIERKNRDVYFTSRFWPVSLYYRAAWLG